MIGADYTKYIPVGTVDPGDVTAFLEAWSRAHAIVRAGDAKAYLGAGKNGWTLPRRTSPPPALSSMPMYAALPRKRKGVPLPPPPPID